MSLVLGWQPLWSADTNAPAEESIATDYYERLAREGSADAQLVLGDHYRDGSNGAVKDLVQAYVWYSVAAHQGVEEAVTPMVEVLQQLSPEEQRRAKVLAEEYTTRFSQ